MIVGDLVRIKSKDKVGVLCAPSTPFMSVFKGTIVNGLSLASVKCLEEDKLVTYCVSGDDLEEYDRTN